MTIFEHLGFLVEDDPPNSYIIAKADLALADLTKGGVLSPNDVRVFLRAMLQQPTLLDHVKFVPMEEPANPPQIVFPSRVLRK